MKNSNVKKLLLISLCASFLALAGCEEKGPMEKAGERVDDAVDNAGDAMDDAKDAADDAADEMEDAVDDVADEVDDQIN